MAYPLLKFFHLLGLTLMGAGLIGVWFADLRSRQVRQLPLFAEAVRSVRVFYDGLVVPGALLLLGSGIWLIVDVYGGWAFLGMPWLVGMVALFAFEFIEGNTVTRLYFVRLGRLTKDALKQGAVTSEHAYGGRTGLRPDGDAAHLEGRLVAHYGDLLEPNRGQSLLCRKIRDRRVLSLSIPSS